MLRERGMCCALPVVRESWAEERAELMKALADPTRLTMVASLLLLPTLIVGVYGQNFHHIPELGWAWGYWWSWGLILATTAAQLLFFRWKRWL